METVAAVAGLGACVAAAYACFPGWPSFCRVGEQRAQVQVSEVVPARGCGCGCECVSSLGCPHGANGAYEEELLPSVQLLATPVPPQASLVPCRRHPDLPQVL